MRWEREVRWEEGVQWDTLLSSGVITPTWEPPQLAWAGWQDGERGGPEEEEEGRGGGEAGTAKPSSPPHGTPFKVEQEPTLTTSYIGILKGQLEVT